MPSPQKTIKVIMLRDTKGQDRDDQDRLVILKTGQSYDLDVRLAQFLIWKQKARAATEADAEAARAKGPVVAPDTIPTKTSRG